MTVVTPTVRKSLRRSLFWITATVVLVLVAVIAMISRGATGTDGVYLSPTNAAPSGAMALAEVLADRGVTVEKTDTMESTLAALGSGDETLLLHDNGSFLDGDQLRSLADAARHTVLIEPSFLQLHEIAPAVSPAGAVDGTLTADCGVTAVTRAESVLGDGSGYRLTDDTVDAELCLGSGDDTYSLVQLEEGGRTVTVLGTSAALSNERVAELGNAALALNLLGSDSTLVWYQPSFADITGEQAPSIAELTPAWLSLVMVLLLLVVVAAGVWRGRRMGPLVVENLPVTVPSSETMEGRARLYQRASARLRALDSLRVGTISRLASACGLPRTAGVDEVAEAVASVTGWDLGRMRQLLRDADPATDRELLRLSDDLLTLEKDVAQATLTGAPAHAPHHQGE